jgi:hypothetical protein
MPYSLRHTFLRREGSARVDEIVQCLLDVFSGWLDEFLRRETHTNSTNIVWLVDRRRERLFAEDRSLSLPCPCVVQCGVQSTSWSPAERWEHDRGNCERAFLAIQTSQHRWRDARRAVDRLTLICRFDSRKPSASRGNVSELQFKVFCNNSVNAFSCSRVSIFEKRTSSSNEREKEDPTTYRWKRMKCMKDLDKSFMLEERWDEQWSYRTVSEWTYQFE